jgi:hypothetical protein
VEWGMVHFYPRTGYAEFYPKLAVFPPLYPLLIKVFSLNQPAAMPWVAIIISNAFSFIALYFLYRLVPLIMEERYRLPVCFAFMVFPVLLVCTFVAYSEALFLVLTIGAYYYWKRSKFALAAILAIGSIFTRQVGAFILIVFVVDMLYEYWSQRDMKRALRQLAATGVTTVGFGALYLFYYISFGNPFIVSQVYSSYWGQNFTLRHVLTTWASHLTAHSVQLS